MALYDKETRKEINIIDITTTEGEVWTKWVLINTTQFAVHYEIRTPPHITIVNKIPDVMTPKQQYDLDVKITSEVTRQDDVEVIPHIVDVKVY